MNSFAQAVKYLADFHGIQTSYLDVFKKKHSAKKTTILQLLNALGVDVDNQHAVIDRAEFEREKISTEALEPVHVTWNNQISVNLCLPSPLSETSIYAELIQENGETYNCIIHLKKISAIKKNDAIGKKKFFIYPIRIDKEIPFGYHHLHFHINNRILSTFIISAPRVSYSINSGHGYGIFAPIYALKSKKNFGCGDLGDWQRLMEWLKEQGGNLMATLPLFANFFDEPFDPSPYSPASRLFYNEIYLDIEKIDEFSYSQKAKSLYRSSAYQEKVRQLQTTKLVNYNEIMLCKRQLLEILCIEFFLHASASRKLQFQNFINTNSDVKSYADFCAQREFKKNAAQSSSANYYLYCQWQMQQQLSEIAQFTKSKNIYLYLDMPLGVHPLGYDIWKNPNLFAKNLSVGAPPDIVYTQGQNWGFPPLISRRLREQNYQYFIQVFSQILKYVDLLRIDHIMGLHRLYCIPKGNEAKDGAFLKYHAEELYAILCVESNKNQSCLVGENLGTVPKYVNQSMKKHHFYQMFVLQHEIDLNHSLPKKNIPAKAIASLNTHDMPTIAAYYQGLDLNLRVAAKLMNKIQAKAEAKLRKKILHQFSITDMLNFLATSPAQFLLINLEDLWYETESQNIPINHINYPNWQKKMKYSLDDIRQNPSVCAILKHIARLCQRRI